MRAQKISSFQELAAAVGACDPRHTAHVWGDQGLRSWTVKAGACLLMRDANADRNHLKVVLSDPDEDGHVLIVGIMTIRDDRHDRACVIMPGDHSFIRAPSTVAYGHCRRVKAATLAKAVESGAALARDAFGDDLLARMRRGLSKSRFTPGEVWRTAPRTWTA